MYETGNSAKRYTVLRRLSNSLCRSLWIKKGYLRPMCMLSSGLMASWGAGANTGCMYYNLDIECMLCPKEKPL